MVWEYPAINTLSKTGDEGNLPALHPTVKPVAMIADALLDCSYRGDLVVDAFLGSGSTLMAAERTGRSCYGIELDPIYVDTTPAITPSIPLVKSDLMILLTSVWRPAVDNGKDKNDNEEIGYKKPPRHSQFKPGQSGNPKGRPKAAPTFADAIAKQLRKKVEVKRGNKVLNIPILQAIAMKHVSLAASGNPKSTAIVLNCLQQFHNDHGNNLPELLEQFRALHANHAQKNSTARPAGPGAVPPAEEVSRLDEASARRVSGGAVRAQGKENESDI